jgi:dipeptidase E
MKHVFLTSQVRTVAASIASKLSEDVKKPAVYITTSFMYNDQSTPEKFAVQNRASLVSAGFNLTDYDITGKSHEEIENDLSKYETMYVEGGNTAYLLKQSQQNNFGEYIKKRVENGMIYIACSAGSIVVGPDIISADRPGKTAKDYGVTDTTGFGLVNFVVMPHWGDPEKKTAYQDYKIPHAYKEDYPYIFLRDNQYFEVTDDWYIIVDVTDK